MFRYNSYAIVMEVTILDPCALMLEPSLRFFINKSYKNFFLIRIRT